MGARTFSPPMGSGLIPAGTISKLSRSTWGFREAGPVELRALGEWLVDRALEHDRPSLLFRVACEHLHAAKIIRPGVTRLERMVATARQRAQRETLQRLASLLTEASRTRLDRLLFPMGLPAARRSPGCGKGPRPNPPRPS